jgi:hypothetical protein
MPRARSNSGCPIPDSQPKRIFDMLKALARDVAKQGILPRGEQLLIVRLTARAGLPSVRCLSVLNGVRVLDHAGSRIVLRNDRIALWPLAP